LDLYSCLFFFFNALIHLIFLQPPFSSASSENASLVPEVGGGPRTSILIAGRSGFTSFQVLFGFVINVSEPSGLGISFAYARYRSIVSIAYLFADFELATTIPS
jgi:hypothetical protein